MHTKREAIERKEIARKRKREIEGEGGGGGTVEARPRFCVDPIYQTDPINPSSSTDRFHPRGCFLIF